MAPEQMTAGSASLDGIIQRLVAYNPKAEVEVCRRAYDCSARAHAGQRRQSGEPFLQHPLEVAAILTQLRLDVPSIAAGFLHDTVEDTTLTLGEVEQQFGPEIAQIVAGVTKIGKIESHDYEVRQAENYRKMILSMAQDIRVILIKLADRLHNMRTITGLPEAKRRRIAQETLDLYAPLANRLGIGWLRNELEDHCFRALKPDLFAQLTRKVRETREARDATLQGVLQKIQDTLKAHDVPSTVTGRAKHLYGISQKMERQGIPFEEVYDVMGIRIITDTTLHCYGALGLVHSLWRPVPGRFKDYIGVPKSNLYQSLHTTVVGPGGQHVECQIRTAEMHRMADEGIAAHWKYKEHGRIDPKDDRIFAWLRQLIEWQQEVADSRQFLDSVRRDLIPDVVYVFTPKGAVKELMKGSTPLDLAYSVHTDVGHHCIGARVNGKLVPLRYPLRSGDTVEILTAPHQTPSRDWLRLVKTSRARAKIKHWLKIEEQQQSLEIGRRLLERELHRHHLSPLGTFEGLRKDLKVFGVETLDDLFVAVGFGRVAPAAVVGRLLPEAPAPPATTPAAPPAGPRPGPGIDPATAGITLRGMGGLLIHQSKCCGPLPGDRIVGYVTRGRGLTIHTADCPNLDKLDYEPDRLVQVQWEPAEARPRPVAISVIAVDRPGTLASVSAAISSTDANIASAEIKTSEDKRARLNFVVSVLTAQHLAQIVKAIEQVDGVLQVRRATLR